MQQLTKQDYTTINETIKTYNRLSKKLKLFVDDKTNQIWYDTFNQYQTLCQQNQEWLRAYEMINDYEKVTDFNLESNFEINVGDSEDRTKVYCASLHQEYIDAYEHVENYKKQINQKISKLDNRRFVIGKKIKINFLQSKLNVIENEANLYTDWKQKDQLKNQYLTTKTQTYQNEKLKLNQIQDRIATEVICNNLQNCAMLIAKPERALLKSTFVLDNKTYKIDSKALTNVCELVKLMAQTINLEKKPNNNQDNIQEI